MFDLLFGNSNSAPRNRNFDHYRNEPAFFQRSSDVPELHRVPRQQPSKWNMVSLFNDDDAEQTVYANNKMRNPQDKQIQKRDMLDTVFESVEGKLCPVDDEQLKSEKEANRNIMKGVVIHKLRKDYERIGKRLDQLTKLASSDASVGTMGTMSTAGKSNYAPNSNGDVFDYIFETFGMCQNQDAAIIADRDVQKWNNYQRAQAYRQQQQQQQRDEQLWMPLFGRSSQVEVRSQPPPPKNQDMLDSMFETLEFGLCAASTPRQ